VAIGLRAKNGSGRGTARRYVKAAPATLHHIDLDLGDWRRVILFIRKNMGPPVVCAALVKRFGGCSTSTAPPRKQRYRHKLSKLHPAGCGPRPRPSHGAGYWTQPYGACPILRPRVDRRQDGMVLVVGSGKCSASTPLLPAHSLPIGSLSAWMPALPRSRLPALPRSRLRAGARDGE
jgi:hypothetical protein